MHVATDAGLTAFNDGGNNDIFIIQIFIHISFAVSYIFALIASGFFLQDPFDTKRRIGIIVITVIAKFALIFFHFISFNMYFLNFLFYVACISHLLDMRAISIT